MKIRNLLFIGLASAVLFAGCKEDEIQESPSLKVEPASLEMFSKQGGESEVQTISLTANREWKANCEEDWIHVEPASGPASADVQTVSVYVDENGEFVLTTAIIIGTLIGTAFGVYEGYKIAESKGATGWDKAGYMLGGGVIGGAAGFFGGWAATAVGAATASAGVGGFLAGAATGGTAGATTGFINVFGMSMLNDPSQPLVAFGQGAVQTGMGALSGAVLGGLIQGTASAIKGNNFLDGSARSTFPKYDFNPDPKGDNITLYRGTTGSETDNGYLFMTDNPEYASSYIANGGKLVSIDIPKTTIELMQYNGDLIKLSGMNANFGSNIYTEYVFSPYVKPEIVIRF